ncbi:MAG: hypothetical protein LBQ88_01010 [Treponema sp.]|nr:hypothetical protein [Treponema sp.]
MKKLVLVLVLLMVVGMFAFAEFELGAGIYGSFMDVTAFGIGLQLGGMGRAGDSLLWDILFDGGMGFAFPDDGIDIDYNAGILGELIFGAVGLGVGAGYGNGSPYIRGEVPFLLGPVKLAGAYDYYLNGGGRVVISLLFRGESAMAFMEGLSN